MPEVRERRRDRHRVSDMGFQVTDDRSKNSAFSHRLTLDLWFARDNRFLNPKSSYERILCAGALDLESFAFFTCPAIVSWHFLEAGQWRGNQKNKIRRLPLISFAFTVVQIQQRILHKNQTQWLLRGKENPASCLNVNPRIYRLSLLRHSWDWILFSKSVFYKRCSVQKKYCWVLTFTSWSLLCFSVLRSCYYSILNPKINLRASGIYSILHHILGTLKCSVVYLVGCGIYSLLIPVPQQTWISRNYFSKSQNLMSSSSITFYWL